MNWFSGLFDRTVKLKESDRKTIFRWLGSFNSNKLAMSQSNVIDEGYANNVDVFSLITSLKDAAISVPWVIERVKSDNSWDLVTDTSLNELISEPNKTKGYTWQDLNEQIWIYLLASGNAYPIGLSAFGTTIDEIDVLPSQKVDIQMINDSWLSPEYKYLAELGRSRMEFERQDVGHIKYFNPCYTNTEESLIGLSPIAVAAQIVNIGNKSLDAESNLIENRGAIGLIKDGGGQYAMTPEEAGRAQEDLDRRSTGTHNKGKVIVTNKDISFIQMAMSPADLELLKNRIVNLRSMCNVLGVNSALYNDPDNKTFNNLKEAEKSFWTRGVIPTNNRIQAKYQNWLLPTHLDKTKYRIRPDYSEVEALQEDFHQKVKSYSIMKTSGIISANTAALALNQPTSGDPNADKLIVSNSDQLLEDISNPQTGNNNDSV